MAQAKRKLQLIDLTGLGAALHTALRKVCDSPPTTVAYKLIQFSEFDGAWQLYLDDARRRLHTAKAKGDLSEILAQAADILSPHRCDEATFNRIHRPAGGAHSDLSARAHALSCVFDMFTQDDWEGFAAFLTIE